MYIDSVAVSHGQSVMFSMSRTDTAAEGQEHHAVQVVQVGSSEAATYQPSHMFSTPVSIPEQPASSAQLSPVQPSPQECTLHTTPSQMQEQRTIFVAGFPLDMTEREFHCLLTFLPGYEACQLSWGTGAPQGFALFKCNADAVAAVDKLAGHQVEVGAVLRSELAHKNLVIKVRSIQHQTVTSSGWACAGSSDMRNLQPGLSVSKCPASVVHNPQRHALYCSVVMLLSMHNMAYLCLCSWRLAHTHLSTHCHARHLQQQRMQKGVTPVTYAATWCSDPPISAH